MNRVFIPIHVYIGHRKNKKTNKWRVNERVCQKQTTKFDDEYITYTWQMTENETEGERKIKGGGTKGERIK